MGDKLKMIKQLIIYRKSEDLAAKLHSRFKHFKREDQKEIAKEMKRATYDLLTNISLAHSVKSKRLFYSQKADAQLHRLQALVMLAKKQRNISLKLHDSISADISELKRMNSAYIRSSAKRK